MVRILAFLLLSTVFLSGGHSAAVAGDDCALSEEEKRSIFIENFTGRSEVGMMYHKRARDCYLNAQNYVKAAEASSYLGSVEASRHNFRKAVRHFIKANEFDPQNSWYVLRLKEVQEALEGRKIRRNS